MEGAPVPVLGRTIFCLAGSATYDEDFLDRSKLILPPDSYDSLLRRAIYAAPAHTSPITTSWTTRAIAPPPRFTNAAKRKYKPVDRKVRPVPSYMPDPAGQEFKPIEIPDLPLLPIDPPTYADFQPTERLTRERLDKILESVPENFLSPRELDLLIFVLRCRDKALAFEDSERGTFSREYYPDYEIPVIEHTPWFLPPIRVPKAIEAEVRRILEEQKAAGKYEVSTASYRSPMFAVAKKDNNIRLVADVQELNKVTIRDSALPPRIDDFAEGFVGRQIYGLFDLFAGYDGRVLAVKSRPLTTLSTLIGALRLTCLPQGATNSVPEFCKCTNHCLSKEIPNNADVFIDDVGAKGPFSDYNNEEITPGIRRFVYEFATTVDRILVRMIYAGITASGKKLILAVPRLHIVGTEVSKEGWHLSHGIVSKVENWPDLESASDVRSFLGTAGVGRKWIKGFSLIAKPLTLLTHASREPFYFNTEAKEAQAKIKALITTAPVLVRLDYEKAKLVTRHHRPVADEGVVIVAIDSSMYGSGWVVYQIQNAEKHPILFGSCTYNETESRYSQPKAELYGVFRALKELRHRIWGIYFRINVDAKFLLEMIHAPDLPNAPMTRWLLYIQLFDFDLVHIPSEKHKAPDGLSRRKPSPLDSDDEDAEAYLDAFIGSSRSHTCSSAAHLSLRDFTIDSITLPTEFFTSWIDMLNSVTPGIGVTYQSASSALDLSYFITVPNKVNSTHVNTEGFANSDISPIRSTMPYSLFDRSLLSANLLQTFVGYDFFVRRVAMERLVECSLGEEDFSICITEYARSYVTGPMFENDTRPDRAAYELPGSIQRTAVACIGHRFGQKDDESPAQWDEILIFLRDGTLPPQKTSDATSLKGFTKRAKQFIYHDDRLWKLSPAGRIPRLLITDLGRRQSLIAEAHNEAGHRGRDGTYKHLADRFYWPNMFNDVAFFVVSCTICQLRSTSRPKVPFSSTWNSTILRRFDLDTVHMPKGHGGKKFLLQAIEPSIGWPEARAVKRNDSETWAKFIFEEIICRFGCIPLLKVDGGREFQGAVEILMKQYGVVAIIATPYSPHNNAVAERAHPTLVESLFRACGTDHTLWPLFLFACLLAMRCTTSRITGFAPYYLLYGRSPLLAFDIADRTWDTLDWHTVRSTADLIGIRAQQIARRDRHLVQALAQQRILRKKAIDEFNHKHRSQLGTGEFKVGTWVLAHETWLDSQVGNKGALRWEGPFIIRSKIRDKVYELTELDGVVKREHYFATRLKIFYYRHDHQTIRSMHRVNVQRRTDVVIVDGDLPEEDRNDRGPYTQLWPPYNFFGLMANKDLVWAPVLEYLRDANAPTAQRFRTCPPISSLAQGNVGLYDPPPNVFRNWTSTPVTHNIHELERWAVEYAPLR